MKGFFFTALLIFFVYSAINISLIEKKVSISYINNNNFKYAHISGYESNSTSQECTTCSNFLLYTSNTCEETKTKNKLLLAYMMIRVDQFKLRNFIRQTWANKEINSNLRLVFIVGKSTDMSVMRLILNENLKYNDLVQGDFIDTYRNLTYKSIIAWKWILKYCSNAKLFIKLDHDHKINMNNLFQYFSLNERRGHFRISFKKTFLCNYKEDAWPLKNKTSKWYVTENEYNPNLYNMSNYPIYCLGSYYIMTPDLIEDLYEASFRLKPFWIEDVYTGLLARTIQHVTYVSIRSENIFTSFNFKSLRIK